MSSPEDKRFEKRILDEVIVFIELESSAEEQRVSDVCITNTLDISAHGLKIMCDKPLPITSLHQLCIEISPLRFQLVGEVVWLSTEDNGFSVGLQLLESQGTDIALWRDYVNKRTLA